MNTFHWHITDSQSFPLEVNGFPELSQKGAYSSDEIYSTSDVNGVVAYAGAVCGDLCVIFFS
jgi:hexosaminidase